MDQQWGQVKYGERLGELADELHAVRVVLSTTLAIDLNRRMSDERGMLPAFDGVAEISWVRGAELMEATEQDAMQGRIAKLRRFQESFLELDASSIFLVSEETVHDSTG